MSVSLPSNKCIEIQQLAHALLLSQPIFCAHGHAQLCQLCHVIQSDMLSLYQSPIHLFIYFHLSLLLQHQLLRLSQLQQTLAPYNFLFLSLRS